MVNLYDCANAEVPRNVLYKGALQGDPEGGDAGVAPGRRAIRTATRWRTTPTCRTG